MYLARTWRLQWRTAFMRFCPNEKGQWIWAWGKRAFEGFISCCMFYWCPLGLLFYPAPAPVWTVHPHAVSFLQHCPSLALVKLGSWVLNLFPGAIYILSSTSSKPFPLFTRNWIPQRMFIMIFIGLCRAGSRGRGSRDRACNSLPLSSLHPCSLAPAHLNSRDQTAQTPFDPSGVWSSLLARGMGVSFSDSVFA